MFAPNRRFVLAGLSGIAVSVGRSFPARAADDMLQPDAMRADIGILYDAYTTLHPGLYRYTTPTGLLHARQGLDNYAAQPRSLAAFYLALSRFTASIRCGHSFLNPANQSATVTKTLFDKPDRLPFAFAWHDGRMIVASDVGSGHLLAPGTQITTIDGVPASDLLATMLPYVRTDGSNDARKIADLGIPGDADQPNFDILRSLLFPASTWSVRLGIDGRKQTITCRLMTAVDRDAALKPRSIGSPYGWRFEVRGTVGILTMPTWAVFHEKWDWQGFIDASIDAAIDQKLPGIVIDLRDNGGGLDCGAAILARLISAPLATDNYSRHVRYRSIPDRLSPYLKTWDRGFCDWGASAHGPDAAGFYRLDRPGDATDSDIIQPTKRRYTGKVFVLVGPKNASATFGFAALIKQHRLATLIGEPTGGNLRGINGGAFFFLRLPESGLEVDLPLIAYWPATPQPDAGVEPDIIVERSLSDTNGDRQFGLAVAMAGAISAARE